MLTPEEREIVLGVKFFSSNSLINPTTGET